MTPGGKLALGIAGGTSAGGMLSGSWYVAILFGIAAVFVILEDRLHGR